EHERIGRRKRERHLMADIEEVSAGLGPAPAGRENKVDHDRIAAAVREILIAVGEDPDREGLVETPNRAARASEAAFAGLHRDPAEVRDVTFDISHEELVLVRDIDLYSTCEHHLVPFHGVAHIGYIPSRRARSPVCRNSRGSSRSTRAAPRSR